MLDFYKKLCAKYKAPKHISDEIHKRNRFHLIFVYGFSTLFGILTLFIALLANKNSEIGKERVFYYLYYIVVGLIGLILSFAKSGKHTPSIALIAFFASIYTYYFYSRPVYVSLLYYFAFMFVIIILFDYNPFVLTYTIVGYHIILGILTVVVPNSTGVLPFKIALNFVLANFCIIYLSFWKRRILLKRYEVEKNIQEEKEKSEELLLNILPEKIMKQLRDTGKSNPEIFENTTVLFAEIVNFDELNEKLETQGLVDKLNEIYEDFDSIVEKNHSVRIKTTGALYMAVCGLPEPNEKHAENMVFCAKQIISFIEKYNQNSKEKVSIRVGLNSGKVIAGIVGIRKYIYDIFGDTVNTASRMQTLSKEMSVNVSENTYALVRDKFNFKKQDAIQVKGKGSMQTYYLDD